MNPVRNKPSTSTQTHEKKRPGPSKPRAVITETSPALSDPIESASRKANTYLANGEALKAVATLVPLTRSKAAQSNPRFQESLGNAWAAHGMHLVQHADSGHISAPAPQRAPDGNDVHASHKDSEVLRSYTEALGALARSMKYLMSPQTQVDASHRTAREQHVARIKHQVRSIVDQAHAFIDNVAQINIHYMADQNTADARKNNDVGGAALAARHLGPGVQHKAIIAATAELRKEAREVHLDVPTFWHAWARLTKQEWENGSSVRKALSYLADTAPNNV